MKAFYVGRREYKQVLHLQEAIFREKIRLQGAARREGAPSLGLPDSVILVEHDTPLYTLGRRDTSDGLPGQCCVPIVRTRRGGGITYHGPGQLTMYPLVNIQNLWKQCQSEKVRSPIEWFVGTLEQSMIELSARYGVPAHRFKAGVWADAYDGCRARKLGSIGLQLGSWVSMHGVGFNVNPDLRYFKDIIMCELPGESATSLHLEMTARGVSREPPAIHHLAPQLYHTMIGAMHLGDRFHAEEMVDLSQCVDWVPRITRSVGM